MFQYGSSEVSDKSKSNSLVSGKVPVATMYTATASTADPSSYYPIVDVGAMGGMQHPHPSLDPAYWMPPSGPYGPLGFPGAPLDPTASAYMAPGGATDYTGLMPGSGPPPHPYAGRGPPSLVPVPPVSVTSSPYSGVQSQTGDALGKALASVCHLSLSLSLFFFFFFLLSS